jgi:ADP-ribose pyrophosphatase YjhB (NUDIX family)
MEIRNERGETLEEFLAHYDETKFRRPSNTVDMCLMTVSQGELKILLIKRKDHPFIHDWAMPGGFVEFDEDMENAVKRELSEETSITRQTYFRQLYTFGNADRDPRTRVITTVYLSMTPESNIKKTKAADDAEDAYWFTIKKETTEMTDKGRKSVITLDSSEKDVHIAYEIVDTARHNYIETRSKLLKQSNAKLATDHIKAINMAMDQLQHRAASTGILFNLLPSAFTLREVQTAYEAVIGRKTDTGNFRRDIKKMLKDTGRKKKAGSRMASLYEFNPMYSYLEENL